MSLGEAACPGGMSLIGGFDVERFATWQLPLFVVFVAWASERSQTLPNPWLWLHLGALHIAAMGFLIPWDPYDLFYLALYVTHIHSSLLSMMLVCIGLALVIPLFMLVYDRLDTECATDPSAATQ